MRLRPDPVRSVHLILVTWYLLLRARQRLLGDGFEKEKENEKDFGLGRLRFGGRFDAR